MTLDSRDGPRDECGVFGIYAPGHDVSRLAYFALYALQHRGQESAGIAATDVGGHIMTQRDLGLVSQVRSPHHEAPTIYLYEAMPGGVGLSERLWARHDELVSGAADLLRACACEAGCPACTGPRLEPDVDGKALALRLLASLGAGAARGGRDAAAAVA